MKNVSVYILLLVFSLSVTGCASDNNLRNSPTITYIGPSDSLLVNPCKAKPAGESLIDLALAQNKNVGCIGLWEKQMDAIRKNKKAQMELYNVK